MSILRVTAQWTGFNGAPGYSVFHFMGGGGLISDAQQVADRTATALANLKPILPSTVRIAVDGEVAILDEATGVLEDFRGITQPPAVAGTVSTGYAGPTGAVVNWRTDDVRGGRRIRGRTFLVPLLGAAYDSSGTLTSSAMDSIRSFADGMIGGDLDSELAVWSRPIDGSGGVAATVVSANVPDKVAVLRSRRG